MYPHFEENARTSAVPRISVTVTALARPTSLPTNVSPAPSPPSSTVPLLDTPTLTHIVLSSLDGGIQSGVPTRTTPTLTPTTLKNIEQLFEVPTVHPPEVHFNQAGFVPPPVQLTTASSTFVSVDNKAWGGGVTTLTQPASVSPAPSNRTGPSPTPPLPASLTEGAFMPSLSAAHNQPGPGRRTGGRRPFKDESLSPEEEERRIQRRERNKQAAARCRKRRLDQTTRLQDETDVLEDKRESLQQEMQFLQQQREELEFLLAAHKTSCKRESLLDLEIKEEPLDSFEEQLSKAHGGGSSSSSSKPLRPTSLAIGPLLSAPRRGVLDLGISIETPSNELRGLGINFEAMMESGSGFTPVSNIMAPISTGLTPLSTPIVSTAPSSNCGTQQRSSSSDLSSPDSVPPKLVSL